MTSAAPWTSVLPMAPRHSSAARYGVLIRRLTAPVSARMMDSAQAPHSFLLDQYGNPPRAQTERQNSFMKLFQRLLLNVDGPVSTGVKNTTTSPKREKKKKKRFGV